MLTSVYLEFSKYDLEWPHSLYLGDWDPQQFLSVEKEIQHRVNEKYKGSPDFRGFYYSLYRMQRPGQSQGRNDKLPDSQVHIFGILAVGFILFSIFISLLLFSP